MLAQEKKKKGWCQEETLRLGEFTQTGTRPGGRGSESQQLCSPCAHGAEQLPMVKANGRTTSGA